METQIGKVSNEWHVPISVPFRLLWLQLPRCGGDNSKPDDQILNRFRKRRVTQEVGHES